eukprot:scaffold22757_cov23-Cyclotella_meneghiniana.AAC.2
MTGTRVGRLMGRIVPHCDVAAPVPQHHESLNVSLLLKIHTIHSYKIVCAWISAPLTQQLDCPNVSLWVHHGQKRTSSWKLSAKSAKKHNTKMQTHAFIFSYLSCRAWEAYTNERHFTLFNIIENS